MKKETCILGDSVYIKIKIWIYLILLIRISVRGYTDSGGGGGSTKLYTLLRVVKNENYIKRISSFSQWNERKLNLLKNTPHVYAE